jgi:hypothetical protein
VAIDKPIPRSTALPCAGCGGILAPALYLARRVTEGKIHHEAIRCLKRYIAREIYQIITSPPEAETSAVDIHMGINALLRT